MPGTRRRSIIRNRSASGIVVDATRAKIHYVELKPQHSGELLDDVIRWRPAPSVLNVVEVLNLKCFSVILRYPSGNLFFNCSQTKHPQAFSLSSAYFSGFEPWSFSRSRKLSLDYSRVI